MNKISNWHLLKLDSDTSTLASRLITVLLVASREDYRESEIFKILRSLSCSCARSRHSAYVEPRDI